jgi:hypothetical protein
VLKYRTCGIWPRVGFVPLKLSEHDVKVNVVPSGPFTVDVPPSPLLKGGWCCKRIWTIFI